MCRSRYTHNVSSDNSTFASPPESISDCSSSILVSNDDLTPFPESDDDLLGSVDVQESMSDATSCDSH